MSWLAKDFITIHGKDESFRACISPQEVDRREEPQLHRRNKFADSLASIPQSF